MEMVETSIQGKRVSESMHTRGRCRSAQLLVGEMTVDCGDFSSLQLADIELA
jgi:hypothetical protein